MITPCNDWNSGLGKPSLFAYPNTYILSCIPSLQKFISLTATAGKNHCTVILSCIASLLFFVIEYKMTRHGISRYNCLASKYFGY